MQYETVLGLRKEHTFDEVRQYIQADPTIIKFPKRDALFFSQSHLYGQVEASMRSYEAGVKDQATVSLTNRNHMFHRDLSLRSLPEIHRVIHREILT